MSHESTGILAGFPPEGSPQKAVSLREAFAEAIAKYVRSRGPTPLTPKVRERFLSWGFTPEVLVIAIGDAIDNGAIRADPWPGFVILRPTGRKGASHEK